MITTINNQLNRNRKRIEGAFLASLTLIVIAKIVLQLTLPDSSPEARWQQRDPDGAQAAAHFLGK